VAVGSEDEFKVFLSKKQPLIWLAVMLGSAYLIYRMDFQQPPMEGIEARSWVALVGCALFSAPIAWLLLRPALAVRMNRKGLYFSTLFAPSFELAWEEIERIHFMQISLQDEKGREADRTLRQRFYVKLKDPGKRFGNLPWIFRRARKVYEVKGIPIVMYLLKTTLSEMGDAFERFAGEKFDRLTMPRALWKR